MMNPARQFISNTPMYNLVGMALVLLVLSAIVASLFGDEPFTVGQIIASLIVLTVSSIGASFAFGKLYGVSSHLPSAGITALILVCILSPSLELSVLLQYGLIAIIAQASKFVIAFRRRHIFNPAAFGVFAGGLIGLPFASWWIANPSLAIVTAILAVVMLYKTELLRVGVLFVAAAVSLLLLRGVETLVIFSSFPVLFLVGFMLTEPLTLPVKTWQKFAVAAVVGVAFSVPFELGFIYSSPELALLIGNALAFGLAYKYRRGITLKLTNRRSLTPTVDEFTFATDKPMQFDPGQYIQLTLPHRADSRGMRRSFSLVSSPGESEARLAIKFNTPSSSFKTKLRALAPGKILHSPGVEGEFTLPDDHSKKLLFIAGGIGITPFISHIQSMSKKRDIVLLYFARSDAELAYLPLLEKSDIDVRCFTVEKSVKKNVVQASGVTTELLESVPELSHRNVYISGPPAMVRSSKKMLRGKVSSITTDVFSGY